MFRADPYIYHLRKGNERTPRKTAGIIDAKSRIEPYPIPTRRWIDPEFSFIHTFTRMQLFYRNVTCIYQDFEDFLMSIINT